MTTVEKSKKFYAVLQELHPQLFTFDKPVPLAIGIHKQIAEAYPNLEPEVIANFCRWWVFRPKYLKATIKKGSARHNLDGTVQQKVSDIDRGHARSKMGVWKRRDEQEALVAGKGE